MKYRTQAGVLSCLTAALCAASFAAQADTVTLSVQFLDVTYDTAQIPASFGKVSIVETPFEWDCGSDSCTMTAPASVSVVFGSPTDTSSSITTNGLEFVFKTVYADAIDVIDPLGHQWGIASVDSGRWSFGANITGQTTPDNALFATAYGQFRGYVAQFPGSGSMVLPTWPQSPGYEPRMNGFAPPTVYIPGWGTGNRQLAYTEASVLGLSQTGWVGFGPGPEGSSLLDDAGVNILWWQPWRLRAELSSAYFVSGPSTTDPRCRSLSCMEFAEGTLDVDRYEFRFAVVATPTPVPEAGSGAMSLIGLGLLGWAVRRSRSATA